MKLKMSIKNDKKFILNGIILILILIYNLSYVTCLKIKLDSSMKLDKSFLLSNGKKILLIKII